MQRFVFEKLIEWKDRTDRKPLILNGARQVGKTWLLQEFAKQEYAKTAYIVCRKNELVRSIFKQDYDMDRILRALCALTKVDITPGDTLIVFDEVQDAPEIIEALKYFYEQLPEYHVAAAGSLLRISLHKDISFPVGKVNELNVYPMNFQEFLLAKGETKACQLLQQRDFETTNLLHDKYVELLRQYYYVGGMPEVVREYITTGALQEVRRIQLEILHGYEMDFSKHAPKEQVQRIRMVWQTIPSQLFKNNKKFIYGALRSGARAKDFEIAIEWLVNSGIVIKVPLCSKVELPMKIYENLNNFKLYMVDVGLLGAMVNTEPVQVLVKNDIFVEYKGGMTEQYVLQEMISHGVSQIYYHKADDSRLEIDFLIQRDAQILPIEVKAGQTVRSNSLSSLLANRPELYAELYSMLPYRRQGQLVCKPLYSV